MEDVSLNKECEVCCMKFEWLFEKQLHMSETHPDVVPPLTCCVCSQSFKSYNSLVIHFRHHSGVEPFTCSLCCKSFLRLNNLSNHLKAKHDVTYQDLPNNKKKTMYCDIGDLPRMFLDKRLRLNGETEELSDVSSASPIHAIQNDAYMDASLSRNKHGSDDSSSINSTPRNKHIKTTDDWMTSEKILSRSGRLVKPKLTFSPSRQQLRSVHVEQRLVKKYLRMQGPTRIQSPSAARCSLTRVSSNHSVDGVTGHSAYCNLTGAFVSLADAKIIPNMGECNNVDDADIEVSSGVSNSIPVDVSNVSSPCGKDISSKQFYRENMKSLSALDKIKTTISQHSACKSKVKVATCNDEWDRNNTEIYESATNKYHSRVNGTTDRELFPDSPFKVETENCDRPSSAFSPNDPDHISIVSMNSKDEVSQDALNSKDHVSVFSPNDKDQIPVALANDKDQISLVSPNGKNPTTGVSPTCKDRGLFSLFSNFCDGNNLRASNMKSSHGKMDRSEADLRMTVAELKSKMAHSSSVERLKMQLITARPEKSPEKRRLSACEPTTAQCINKTAKKRRHSHQQKNSWIKHVDIDERKISRPCVKNSALLHQLKFIKDVQALMAFRNRVYCMFLFLFPKLRRALRSIKKDTPQIDEFVQSLSTSLRHCPSCVICNKLASCYSTMESKVPQCCQGFMSTTVTHVIKAHSPHENNNATDESDCPNCNKKLSVSITDNEQTIPNISKSHSRIYPMATRDAVSYKSNLPCDNHRQCAVTKNTSYKPKQLDHLVSSIDGVDALHTVGDNTRRPDLPEVLHRSESDSILSLVCECTSTVSQLSSVNIRSSEDNGITSNDITSIENPNMINNHLNKRVDRRKFSDDQTIDPLTDVSRDKLIECNKTPDNIDSQHPQNHDNLPTNSQDQNHVIGMLATSSSDKENESFPTEMLSSPSISMNDAVKNSDSFRCSNCSLNIQNGGYHELMSKSNTTGCHQTDNFDSNVDLHNLDNEHSETDGCSEEVGKLHVVQHSLCSQYSPEKSRGTDACLSQLSADEEVTKEFHIVVCRSPGSCLSELQQRIIALLPVLFPEISDVCDKVNGTNIDRVLDIIIARNALRT